MATAEKPFTTIKRFKINIQEKTIWPIRNMALKPTFFLHL
jgi:hypothetical protein